MRAQSHIRVDDKRAPCPRVRLQRLSQLVRVLNSLWSAAFSLARSPPFSLIGDISPSRRNSRVQRSFGRWPQSSGFTAASLLGAFSLPLQKPPLRFPTFSLSSLCALPNSAHRSLAKIVCPKISIPDLYSSFKSKSFSHAIDEPTVRFSILNFPSIQPLSFLHNFLKFWWEISSIITKFGTKFRK